jgi:hypothetical protein
LTGVPVDPAGGGGCFAAVQRPDLQGGLEALSGLSGVNSDALVAESCGFLPSPPLSRFFALLARSLILFNLFCD